MTTPAPVPPPPEPPAPIPAPTVEVHPNIEVHVPPPVGPTHSFGDWLYTNGATLLAAAGALLAAYVAWLVVRKQIAANAAQLNRQLTANQDNVNAQINANAEQIAQQIKANQDNVNAQLDADRRYRKRQERLNVVDDAYAFVHDIFRWAVVTRRNPAGRDVQEQQGFEIKLLLIASKLQLVALPVEGQAVVEYWDRAKERADGKNVNLATSYSETIDALKHSLDDDTDDE
jgi:hypothetical protein